MVPDTSLPRTLVGLPKRRRSTSHSVACASVYSVSPLRLHCLRQLQTMWRVAVARRRLRSVAKAIPRLQAAVRAWKVRANHREMVKQRQRQQRDARIREQRLHRIDHQRQELEMLRAMRGRSEHVRVCRSGRVRVCVCRCCC